MYCLLQYIKIEGIFNGAYAIKAFSYLEKKWALTGVSNIFF